MWQKTDKAIPWRKGQGSNEVVAKDDWEAVEGLAFVTSPTKLFESRPILLKKIVIEN